MSRIKRRTLSIFMLAMINVAAISNLANLPINAKYGFASLFYFILAAVIFFIPVSLISAELATGWPELGGVYIWVKEALGDRFGFIAIWLQWVENIIWYPTTLSFTAVTFAYVFYPELSQNKFYIMGSILIIFWSVTIINFLGMKISGWVSSLCVITGTIIPVVSIILLGAIWIILKRPTQIHFTLEEFLPNITTPSQLALMAGVLLSLMGLEMSAVHAKEVENPQKNYPKAILLSTLIIFSILSLGTLSIAIIVPQAQIHLASGPIEAFRDFLNAYNITWAIPIVAFLITIGSLGTVSTWTVGPIKGILATALNGELPPFFQKVNKQSMPVVLLTIQAIIVSILSMVFLFMPTVSASYWLLACMTAQLYLIMYILMFISGIILRYKMPNIKRTFKIPMGNWGIGIVATLGILGASFAIIMGFLPPPQFITEDIFIFESLLIGGIFTFCIIPLIIHQFKKPSWHLTKATKTLKKDKK